MRHLGVSVIFTPFFWTLDWSWQENWRCWCVEVGPIALRIWWPK